METALTVGLYNIQKKIASHHALAPSPTVTLPIIYNIQKKIASVCPVLPGLRRNHAMYIGQHSKENSKFNSSRTSSISGGKLYNIQKKIASLASHT